MFLENMEAAESTEESALLMTAAEMAPRPMKETKLGVRYWMTKGRIMAVFSLVMQASGASHSKSVSFQAAGGEARGRERGKGVLGFAEKYWF